MARYGIQDVYSGQQPSQPEYLTAGNSKPVVTSSTVTPTHSKLRTNLTFLALYLIAIATLGLLGSFSGGRN